MKPQDVCALVTGGGGGIGGAIADELLVRGASVLLVDRDEAWKNFAGWRVNYDRVLIGLARLTSAPFAPWSSDRSLPDMRHIPGFSPFDLPDTPTYEHKNKKRK